MAVVKSEASPATENAKRIAITHGYRWLGQHNLLSHALALGRLTSLLSTYTMRPVTQ